MFYNASVISRVALCFCCSKLISRATFSNGRICIFQIGENVKTLRKRFPEKYGSKYWRGIAGTRDVIGHGYESFDMESLWVTVSERIPELRGICYDLLDELEE